MPRSRALEPRARRGGARWSGDDESDLGARSGGRARDAARAPREAPARAPARAAGRARHRRDVLDHRRVDVEMCLRCSELCRTRSARRAADEHEAPPVDLPADRGHGADAGVARRRGACRTVARGAQVRSRALARARDLGGAARARTGRCVRANALCGAGATRSTLPYVPVPASPLKRGQSRAASTAARPAAQRPKVLASAGARTSSSVARGPSATAYRRSDWCTSRATSRRVNDGAGVTCPRRSRRALRRGRCCRARRRAARARGSTGDRHEGVTIDAAAPERRAQRRRTATCRPASSARCSWSRGPRR